jgi:hypothetical protein
MVVTDDGADALENNIGECRWSTILAWASVAPATLHGMVNRTSPPGGTTGTQGVLLTVSERYVLVAVLVTVTCLSVRPVEVQVAVSVTVPV